jgi:hypothetical protein
MSQIHRARSLAALTVVAIIVATTAVAYAATADSRHVTRPESLFEIQLRVRPLQPDPGLLVPADPEAHLWPRNDRGLTYGTPTETEKGYHEPDLIRVVATNGKVGYAYRTDLDGMTPDTPAQAVEWQVEQAGRSRVIPVCEADGVTRIGEFVVSGGR